MQHQVFVRYVGNLVHVKTRKIVDVECWFGGLSVLLWKFDMFFILSDLLWRICRASFADFEFHGS